MAARCITSTLLILSSLGLLGCGGPMELAEPVRPVRAFKVGTATAIAGREFPGRASAKSEVDLSFQVSGPLMTLPVDVGSEVKKGDVIASIQIPAPETDQNG